MNTLFQASDCTLLHFSIYDQKYGVQNKPKYCSNNVLALACESFNKTGYNISKLILI